jgi:hypothetical protein
MGAESTNWGPPFVNLGPWLPGAPKQSVRCLMTGSRPLAPALPISLNGNRSQFPGSPQLPRSSCLARATRLDEQRPTGPPEFQLYKTGVGFPGDRAISGRETSKPL